MRRRGFTYAEMIVVIGALMVLAGTATLRYTNMLKGNEQRLFKMALVSLVTEARSRAVESGDTVGIGYDKGTREFTTTQENLKAGTQEVRRLKVPEGIEAERFAADQDESTQDGWRVPIYPDGSSAGGGIEFKADEDQFSFSVQKPDARPLVRNGTLPDQSLDQWPAGDYERRD